jgi:hypothetical protein
MKGLRRLVAGLTITTGIAFCQPRDVKGWGNIKWGMTVAEAKSALGNQVSEAIERPSDDGNLIGKAVINDVRIGDITARLTIQTRKNSDVVSGLEVMAVGPDPSDGFVSTASTTLERFLKLRAFLTKEHGSPKSEDRNRSDNQGHILSSVVWRFPSTLITLLSTETAGLRIGYVKVQYAATDEK